jgi:hypothetical protein
MSHHFGKNTAATISATESTMGKNTRKYIIFWFPLLTHKNNTIFYTTYKVLVRVERLGHLHINILFVTSKILYYATPTILLGPMAQNLPSSLTN